VPDGFAAPVRVPVEYVGRVRALRSVIAREDERYVATSRRLLRPVLDRLHRFGPRRNFRPQMLADLEAAWHRDLASPYRLGCESQLSKEALRIDEVAISSAHLDNREWDREERSLVIAHGVLIVQRGRVTFDCRLATIFSAHSLCRRLQRGRSGMSDDELLDDVQVMAGHEASEIGENEGFLVHTRDGRWAGRCIQLERGRALSVRTWLQED
jgi:hypothetical protein